MNSVATALQHMQLELTREFADAPGFTGISVALNLSERSDPLGWLTGQVAYPQFYWQHRNGAEEVAALGQVNVFSSLGDAALFCQQQAKLPTVRLWGLNGFDSTQGYLFLPRLEWRRTGGEAVLWLWLYSETSLREDARQAQAFLQQLLPETPIPSLNLTILNETHQPDLSDWCHLIHQATQAIEEGALDKVVLARATDMLFSSAVSAAGLMAASRRVNLNCYHFLMVFNRSAAFLGSSPERLWLRVEKHLYTEALAGTVISHDDDGRAQALADWLLKDDKNQRENMLVLEDICQRLQNVVDELDVLPPQVIRLRNVQHLKRGITARLKKPDDRLCLDRLQPTAAVAGLPREPARVFITEHEPFDREWYAGSAGYLSVAKSEFCVALRSAKVAGNQVRLYAGAGIVAGSVARQEWQEIDNKAAGLRTLLLNSIS
ncbi:isochorismate synthase MenF [Citrobacter sp. JGM124]|uniref:isochorismate synthase MenF n=1 Tax=Citrobacter sp. JGM124 TaxID=2799789 RepID=UPI001BA6EF65|nr:isochorismate synthase MenF [Citrobacter sp. JGM124]